MVRTSRPSLTVLIVEDETLIRVMLNDLFEDAGFTVLEAATAADGMSILFNQGQCINLLLTDVRMPGNGDGLELASWMREHCPNAKIMVMSGYTGENGLEAAHGYDAFVPKPFDPPRLVSLARELLVQDREMRD